jgi:hypothetical protein
MKTTDFITETSQIAQEADDMHVDHEVQMARADCYNAAQYAIKLHRLLKDMPNLDGWVSEKITLANDYLRTVTEYLEHEEVHGEESQMVQFSESAMDFAIEQMIAETTGVTDYNPKSKGGTRKELLAKYAKSGSSKDAEAARKAGATQKELQAAKKQVKEDASAGGMGASSVAISMSGGSGKPGTGKPKKLGNAMKKQNVQVGKGVY